MLYQVIKMRKLLLLLSLIAIIILYLIWPWIQQPNPTYKAFNDAIVAGTIQDVHSLLRSGSNVNVRSKYGSTPLHRALLFNKTDIARLLIQNGAHVNATTYKEHYLHKKVRESIALLRPEFIPTGNCYYYYAE